MVIWAVESILAQDAFRAVFAVLFGAGVAILFERGVTLRGHLARMLVLLIIGYLHAVLLNNGDVLRLYALTGLVLSLLLRLSQRGLLVAIGLLAALHLRGLGWFMWGWLRYWWDVQHGLGDPAALWMWQTEFGVEPTSLERGLAEGRETLSERIARRAFNWQGPLVIFLAFLPQTLAAMLLGVWSWRSGLLRGDWKSIARDASRSAWRSSPYRRCLDCTSQPSGAASPGRSSGPPRSSGASRSRSCSGWPISQRYLPCTGRERFKLAWVAVLLRRDAFRSRIMSVRAS